MSKDTKNSSADLSRYRWVELFDFVLSERDGFETDTLVYLQIMFGMFNGAIVDEKALPVNDLDSYLAAVKVLKKSLKHIQKAFPDNSRYSNILSGVLDILERTDYHSYEPIFKIMKLCSKIFDTMVLTTAFTNYGISYPGYRYFNPEGGYLSNTLTGHTAKSNKIVFGARDESTEESATDSIAVKYQSVMDYLDDHVDREHITEAFESENSGRNNEHIRQHSEHLLLKVATINELEKRLRLSFRKRYENFMAEDSDQGDVHFIDFIRKAEAYTTARNIDATSRKTNLKKQRSSLSFRAFTQGKKNAKNVLWGVRKKCTYDKKCKGEYSSRRWLRNTYFHKTYCPECMERLLSKRTKKGNKSSTDINDIDPYKCNIEGGESVYEFVLDGHLKSSYTTEKAAKIEELKIEMDNILSRIAYIEDGKSKMTALKQLIKRPNNVLDKAFKRNHDWRKRLILIDHFDGKVRNKGSFSTGDMIIYRPIGSHTYKEGMVIAKKSKAVRSDDDKNTNLPLKYINEDGAEVEDRKAKYVVLLDGVQRPVYDSREIKDHHVTIFSYMRQFFKSDALGDKISGFFFDQQGGGEKMFNVTRKSFCIELARCLSLINKLDWSQKCHQKYLEFVNETLIEVEKIYIVKLLACEMHRVLQKRKSQKITPHGLGKLAYVLTGQYRNTSEVTQYLRMADNDNDGYLSCSDFVRFSARPLLEQYTNTVNPTDKKLNSVGEDVVLSGTANVVSVVMNAETTNKGRNEKKKDDLSMQYDQFPETQKVLIDRLRRLQGTYVPTSPVAIERDIVETENFYVELSRILQREDEVEEKILEYERKYDIHENMTSDEISSRRMLLYKRCETLNIMYGWCDPKYWEYDHDLELYAAMAEEQVRIEHGET
eukprot:g4203.t1